MKTSQPIANKASTKAFSVLESRINYSMLLLPQTCSEIWDWICPSMPAIDLTIQKSKHWLKAFLSHSAMHFRGFFVPGLLISRVTDGLLRKLPIFWAHQSTEVWKHRGALSPPLQVVNICCLWSSHCHNHYPTLPLKPIAPSTLLPSKVSKMGTVFFGLSPFIPHHPTSFIQCAVILCKTFI